MVRLHATQLPGLVYDAAVQGCISSNLFKVLSFIQIKKRIVKIQLVCILILFHFGLRSKAKFTIIALVFCFIILLLLGSSVYIKYIYWSFFSNYEQTISQRPFHRFFEDHFSKSNAKKNLLDDRALDGNVILL